MQRQRVLHILQVDKLADLPVRIAGDVDKCALPFGRCREAMDRHDREKLAERPMIEERLENGEVADVLIA